MKLTDSVVRSFKVAKVFRENQDKINSIDFSANGEKLIRLAVDKWHHLNALKCFAMAFAEFFIQFIKNFGSHGLPWKFFHKKVYIKAIFFPQLQR